MNLISADKTCCHWTAQHRTCMPPTGKDQLSSRAVVFRLQKRMTGKQLHEYTEWWQKGLITLLNTPAITRLWIYPYKWSWWDKHRIAVPIFWCLWFNEHQEYQKMIGKNTEVMQKNPLKIKKSGKYQNCKHCLSFWTTTTVGKETTELSRSIYNEIVPRTSTKATTHNIHSTATKSSGTKCFWH